MKNNIKKCDVCKLTLISEESINHKCGEITDHWIINDQFWIGDVIQYYPMNLTDRKVTSTITPDKLTEP